MAEKEKMHKVNVNLCELDFRQFEAMVKATGMSKSDLIRQFIHSPKSINVRYDADRVIREMGRVQESLNSKYHFMLDELDVKSKEIAELKTRLNLNMPLDRPAKISCAELETGIEKMRIVVERVKEAHDKELYEIVNFCYFGGCTFFLFAIE